MGRSLQVNVTQVGEKTVADTRWKKHEFLDEEVWWLEQNVADSGMIRLREDGDFSSSWIGAF